MIRTFAPFLAMLFLLSACKNEGSGSKATTYRSNLTSENFEYNGELDDPSLPLFYPLQRMDQHVWFGANMKMQILESWCLNDGEGGVCTSYGRFYTQAGASFVCQSFGNGWRLPTLDEWKTLLLAKGGYEEDGKEKGPAPYAPVYTLTGEEFNVLLVGRRNPDGTYVDFNDAVSYWSSTRVPGTNNKYYAITFRKGKPTLVEAAPTDTAFPCRCVRELGAE